MSKVGIAAALVAALMAANAESQTPAAPSVLTYAGLADLALDAPLAIHARVRSATRLKPQDSPSVASGKTRFYVEADTLSLIRGAQGLPARITYLVDLADEPGGRPARLKRKSEYILLARPVAGRPGEIRLVAPDAQIVYNPSTADRLRALLREAIRPDAAPAIVGIGKAFHVPGSLPGESETQIFLLAGDQRPVSITILRRPGEVPAWAVSLTEIVDNAAEPPPRDSLLWYRLACTLPASLPRQSIADADPGEARAIIADYRLVLDRLGPCPRTRAVS